MLISRSVFLSIALWGALFAVLRVAVIPAETCGLDGRDQIANAAAQARDWMIRAARPDGTYVYIYDSATDTIPDEYNEVRHAGVTMSLYQAAGRLDPDGSALATADAAMDWMIDRLVYQDDWAAFAPDGRTAPLGNSALMLVSLIERRAATGDDQYDGLIRSLARFIVASQKENGSFYVYWYPRSGEFDQEATSRYYPGEAWFALTLMQNTFPDEGWDEPAWRAAEYVTQHRDEDEDIEFPPLADQWAAYALAEMRDWNMPDRYIDYARALAGRWGLVVRTESQKKSEPLGDLVRGGKSRGSGIGTWAEGLASLWRLATHDERLDDIRGQLEDRTQCLAGLLAERQIDANEAQDYARPDLVEGAILTSSGETRMDDQQHVFSGLLYIVDVIDGRTDREPGR